MISSAGMDLVRGLFANIDKAIYSLIAILYELIEVIARHELAVSIDEIANKIYSFIGIFMLFKITFSLINYIINPDTIADKEKGGSKLITNIVITFALIIVEPLGFKLLYEAQGAILDEHILSRILLGNSDDRANQLYISPYCEDDFEMVTPKSPETKFFHGTFSSSQIEYKTSLSTGQYIAMITLRPFVQVDEDAYDDNPSSGENFLKNTNYCKAKNIRELLAYDIVTFDDSKLKNPYFMDYSYFVSTIIGIIVLLIFAGFCLDAALRTIKLYFLQIIAPIPIMSYIDPASSKKGLFSKWLKEVGTTWADLFLRLAAVYFAIFIISNIQSFAGDNFFVNLILILGALMFAKKLPDILKKMFNIDLKGDFKLNPLKKYKEALDVAKPVTGLAGGAIGLAAGARNFRNGSTWKQKLANGFSGMKKGAVNGYKNPFSITKGGLSPIIEPYIEKTKKAWKEQDEATSKLKEFDKLNDKGQKLIDKAKTGNIKDGKYEIDQTKNFKNQEYIDSFNKVTNAKNELSVAKKVAKDANSELSRINAGNLTEDEKQQIKNGTLTYEGLRQNASNQAYAADEKVSKKQNVLDGLKERHKIVQDKYRDDAKSEKEMKEFMDRNPDYLNVSNANIDNATVSAERTQSSSPQANPAVQNANRNNATVNVERTQNSSPQVNPAVQNANSESQIQNSNMPHMDRARKNTEEELANGVDKVFEDSDFVSEPQISGMTNEEYEKSMAGDETIIDKVVKAKDFIMDQMTKDHTTEEDLHYTSHIDEETNRHFDENGHFDMSTNDMYEEALRRDQERRTTNKQENTVKNRFTSIFNNKKDE